MREPYNRPFRPIATVVDGPSGVTIPVIDVPVLTGFSPGNQAFLRGVDIGFLSITEAFRAPPGGEIIGYRLSNTSSSLPDGLTFDGDAGRIAGRPTEITIPSIPRRIQIQALGNGDVQSASLEFEIAVTGPTLFNLVVTDGAFTFETDTLSGVIIGGISDGSVPSEAEIIAQTGVDILDAWEFPITGASNVYEMDNTAYGGTTAVFWAMQVTGDGAWSYILSQELEIDEGTVSTSATFGDAMWSVATGDEDELVITINSLPGDGGSAITDVVYDVDGDESETSLPSYSGTGPYTITLPAPDTEYDIRLKAENANGLAANWSNAKAGVSGSATAGLPTTVGDAESTSEAGGETTSFAATMPSGITASNKLIAIVSADDGPTMTASGWTKLGQDDQFNNVAMAVFEKTAAGSDTLTVALSGSQHVCAHVIEVSNVTTIEVTFSTGTSTAPDPPNHSLGGGSDDALVFAAATHDRGLNLVTAIPTGYTGVGSGVRVPASNGTGLRVAQKSISAAAENPDAFTVNGSEQWVAATIVAY